MLVANGEIRSGRSTTMTFRRMMMTDSKVKTVSPYLLRPLRSIQEVLAERRTMREQQKLVEARKTRSQDNTLQSVQPKTRVA